MIKKILLLLAFLSVINIAAQDSPFYESYDWEENPIADFDPNSYKGKDIVALKEKNISEFMFENKKGLTEYLLIHHMYWLNSNDAIEDYNKVYLPSIRDSRLIKNKARVITQSGKIIELDNSKILESTNNETKVTSRYYAMEGIEIGGFIEYFYVVEKSPSYTGKRIYLQDNYPKKQFDFELYAPSNLKFAFKVFEYPFSLIIL